MGRVNENQWIMYSYENNIMYMKNKKHNKNERNSLIGHIEIFIKLNTVSLKS